MAEGFVTDTWLVGASSLQNPNSVLSLMLFAVLLSLYLFPFSMSGISLLNPKKPFEFTYSRSRKAFIARGGDMIWDWFKKHPERPVRAVSDIGMMTILPPSVADEIRNDPRLSFSRTLENVFHSHIPGFDGFRPGVQDRELVVQVIVKELTKSLMIGIIDKVTGALSKEAGLALSDIFTDNEEWHQIHLKSSVLPLVSRMSSRVFLGKQMCRNEEWLKVTGQYTTCAIAAAEQLRVWPVKARYLVHWFIPSCRKLSGLVREARRIITPVIEQRRKERLALHASDKGVELSDAIDWFERNSNGAPYDPALTQLFLSLSAINTTTDLICQVMSDLAQRPEIIQPLRDEIISVCAGGMDKTSFYNLKLLDSVIKETQRLKPINIASMRRLALQDVRLSDGTIIRKGEMISVSSHLMWDASVYDAPEKWDGYRFYNMRQLPGKENASQLVSTGPTHLGWGHGQQACPGRFFAANEVKIALIHLLLKYDWRLAPDSVPKTRPYGTFLMTDPNTNLEIRRRQEEIHFS